MRRLTHTHNATWRLRHFVYFAVKIDLPTKIRIGRYEFFMECKFMPKEILSRYNVTVNDTARGTNLDSLHEYSHYQHFNFLGILN